ncbi:hypothetical protein RO3G_00521 [Rhizopus delemar RA 99-880]|uniref:Uncharacterized protein n=1 Tax=Rhizopus delemar (strain RA 99-880 / ATCC MYA-4621 / FGSC 9543 / NRRL 43880) TaxID=246409 RepID=I1BHY7_RHIO9|nr:hypothetical protein RO3G_00521 [Rhizopus delemar RA 99-880]|eukprot:EIE75817.1 hypothetical protein RO3G_00521 [Rhizopus delemar RA 99-880]
MVDLLRKCAEHSMQMGYRWNPSKCVILDNQPRTIEYAIYDQVLSQATTFTYLGTSFKLGGYLDLENLVQSNIFKAMSTMNVLSSIGLKALRGTRQMNYQKTALWRMMPPTITDLDTQDFRAIKKKFLHSNFEKQIQGKNSRLLSSCRPAITLDPISWLPMTHEERSRCIRWRLGWLPDGALKPYPYHPNNNLSRRHAISCLNMHRRLCMPETIAGPISFFLNMLLTRTFVLSSIALS